MVDLHSCPGGDCSIAVETVGIKISLLKNNIWLVYHDLELFTTILELMSDSQLRIQSLKTYNPLILNGFIQ